MGHSFRGKGDQWDAQALPKHGRRFRAYAARLFSLQPGINLPGEWTGPTVGHARAQTNDSVLALASFISRTMTDGCGCEQCAFKRDLIWTLIFSPAVDEGAIHAAISEPPAGVPMPAPSNRGRPSKSRRTAA